VEKTRGLDEDHLVAFAISMRLTFNSVKDPSIRAFMEKNPAGLVKMKGCEKLAKLPKEQIKLVIDFYTEKYTRAEAEKRVSVPPVDVDASFVFTEDDAFTGMLAVDHVKWEPWIEVYKLNTRNGVAQDVLGKRRGVTQKAISNWVRSVKGELARRRGEQYEIHLEGVQRASGKWKTVTRISGEGNSDIIRITADATAEVVSVKCHDTVRPETSLITDENNPKCEITPELAEVRARLARHEKVKLVVHFYNHSSKFVEERVLDPDHLPVSITFIER
jgi:hypothetical protein